MIATLESILLEKLVEQVGPSGSYLIAILTTLVIAIRSSKWIRERKRLPARFQRALAWPPFLLPILTAAWVSNYTASPTGEFWSTPSPLVRLQVEIQREPNFSFSASGLDVKVSHASDTPGNPELWLRYRGDSIPMPKGISLKMAPDAWLTSSVRLERDCHVRTPLGHRILSFVVLDDRRTSTVLGVMLQEGEISDQMGAVSGCG